MTNLAIPITKAMNPNIIPTGHGTGTQLSMSNSSPKTAPVAYKTISHF